MELSTKASFSTELVELPKMIHWVRGYLLQLGIDPILMRKTELALEEALVNIIHHAHLSKGSKVEIGIIGKEKSFFEISIVDRAAPFNPLDQKATDMTLPLEERKVGGVGIHLMKHMVDEVIYRREKGQNILILKKKMNP